MNQRTVDLSQIEILILDEADRMLDMGFIRDIKKIIATLPKKRQNLLFSATYSKEIRQLCENLLRDPVSVEVTKRNSAAEQVEQIVHKTNRTQKRHLLSHLIKEQAWYRVLIFTRTKHGANRLCKQLGQSGIPSRAIHGNKSQSARNKAMDEFRKGDIQALVATDVAARGIHLEDLSHVVNFDLPSVPEDYIHRIGRTGRAGKSGAAISLVTPEDTGMLNRIQRLLKRNIPVDTVESFVPVTEPRQNNTQSPSLEGRKRNRGKSRRSRGGNSRHSSSRRENRQS